MKEIEKQLHFLYEYIQNEQARNENALIVAVNNFVSSRRVDRVKASEVMVLVDRKEYFEKVAQDLYIVISVMRGATDD